MKFRRKEAALCIVATVGIGLAVLTSRAEIHNTDGIPSGALFKDPAGFVSTVSTRNKIDQTNAFFQDLGTNGRSCATCHQISDGMSITPSHIQKRFQETDGLDPLFRANDGSDCDHDIDVSTVAGRRRAYSQLLSRGLIRVALAVPPGADFDVVGVRNPYGCSETATLSMYRRPLPSTNLEFLSTVMWDGRESIPPSTRKIDFGTAAGDLQADLEHQSVSATNGHAQGIVPLSVSQQQEIVAFEMSLFTAQAIDQKAGSLNWGGATGGPSALIGQRFYIGINDPLGLNPMGTPFTPAVFNLYDVFSKSSVRDKDKDNENGDQEVDRRASISRGQALFNSRTISITGVGGLNDALAVPSISGTCGTCHDSFNVGNHSITAPLNIGVSDHNSPLNLDYLPMITLRNRTSGATVQTTDPGRAMITGKWEDISKMKGPILRGLAGRAPYFHNGSAETLENVVEFYDQRFLMGLTHREKADLVAFLEAL